MSTAYSGKHSLHLEPAVFAATRHIPCCSTSGRRCTCSPILSPVASSFTSLSPSSARTGTSLTITSTALPLSLWPSPVAGRTSSSSLLPSSSLCAFLAVVGGLMAPMRGEGREGEEGWQWSSFKCVCVCCVCVVCVCVCVCACACVCGMRG